MDHIAAARSRVRAEEYPAVASHRRADGAWFLDFGAARFATLSGAPHCDLVVELGEVLAGEDALDPEPGGHRRYRRLPWFAGIDHLAIPRDVRNTTPPAVLVPDGLPEVMPFRAIVIHGWPDQAGDPADRLRMRALTGPCAQQGSWSSSDTVLDAVDALCRHTMQATSFLGIWVDGDRERIAYEGDALINAWGHFACDADPGLCAATIEQLLAKPTWPAEWHLQLGCLAWEYLLASGDSDLWHRHAEALEARGLGALQAADGWLDTGKPAQTPDFLASIAMPSPVSYVIDWPLPERDGCVEGHRITPVNAWFVRAQDDLARGFAACGMTARAERCRGRAERCRAALLRDCWDDGRGRFRDAAGHDHTSLHSSAFALACGVLAPGDPRARACADWVAERGMACSVYAAQHLVDALFAHGRADAGHRLLAATGARSWHGMIEQGATMCMEAWSDAVKPNQDWNHAWGGAPANLLPRRVAGVRPTAPGWASAVVDPQPGPLERFRCVVPTPHGPISVNWDQRRADPLQVDAPAAIAISQA